MTSVRPEHKRQMCVALDRHSAALQSARARLDRAESFADRMAVLRMIEAALADLGRHVGEARRLAISAFRAHTY